MSASVHLAGMVSSMDIQSTIDKLLDVEVEKISAVEEKRVALEADVTAWTDIGGSLTTLTDALYALKSYDTWNKMTATASNASKLSAVATSTAVESVYDIVITTLAKAHSVASDTAGTLGLAGITSTLVGTVPGLSAGDSFVIEGQTITIEAGDTLSSLRSKINTASDSMDAEDQVYASILDNRLVITRVNSGNTDIVMANSSGTPLTDLGIFTGLGAWKNELVESQDAVFSVNGADVTRSKNTGLTDVIENVTLNLLGTAAEADGLTLTVSRDTETPKVAIYEFITSYNSAVEKLEEYVDVNLDDPKNPIVGELQGDTLVGSILFNLRRLVTGSKSAYMDVTNASYTYDGRSGVMDSLGDVGIGTEGTENRLYLSDESRLDYALTNYYDKIEQLFRGVAGGSGYEHGVAGDMYNFSYNLSTDLSGQVANRKNAIQTQIDGYAEKIEKMYAALDEYEQNLWTQFGAMEEAISQMEGDVSWLNQNSGK